MGVGMKGAIVFSLWLVTEVVTSTDTDKLRCSKLRRVADEFCSTTGVDSQTCSRVKELYQSRCVAVASSQISSATDGRSLQMSKELESCRADVRRLHRLGTEIGSLGSEIANDDPDHESAPSTASSLPGLDRLFAPRT